MYKNLIFLTYKIKLFDIWSVFEGSTTLTIPESSAIMTLTPYGCFQRAISQIAESALNIS